MKATRLRKKDLPPDQWPFTVPSVRIEKDRYTNALFVKANNTTYALNGVAISAGKGEDLDEIWMDVGGTPKTKDIPLIKGVKMSLQPVFVVCIKRGLVG